MRRYIVGRDTPSSRAAALTFQRWRRSVSRKAAADSGEVLTFGANDVGQCGQGAGAPLNAKPRTVKGVPAGQAEIIVCSENFHGRPLAIVGLLMLVMVFATLRRPPLAPRLLVQHEMQRCEHGVVVEERAVAKVRAVAEAACATDPRARISRRVGRAGEARGACGGSQRGVRRCSQ